MNLKIFEACDTPAPAFAAALLGDFGARVTVIESAEGSGLRRLGSKQVQEVWWPIIGRNKRSLVLDDADPDRSQALRAINPRLVMASISGFGQTGPHASRPGFGKIAEAMSGTL